MPGFGSPVAMLDTVFDILSPVKMSVSVLSSRTPAETRQAEPCGRIPGSGSPVAMLDTVFDILSPVKMSVSVLSSRTPAETRHAEPCGRIPGFTKQTLPISLRT